jgi:hypothetical protein
MSDEKDPWVDDTGLRNLREELVASFPARKAELDARAADFARLRAGGKSEQAHEALLAIHVVVHKLAGAASSYQLLALGSLAEALDDILCAELSESRKNRPGPELDALAARAAVVSRALGEAFAAKGDAPKAAGTPEGRKLISDAESLPSEASS